jgi:pimeloyl-ACP methyl ester carboxylesterase
MSDFKEGAEEIARLVALGRSAIIEGAAHLAPMEAPDEFRALVTGFLASIR